MATIPPYVVLNKAVGQTPLEAVEFWRSTQGDTLKDVPLAYAGRLDPMASGKLLVLIGDTCKIQEQYHGLDKTYEFSVVFGLSSDSGDVLGLVKEDGQKIIAEDKLVTALVGLVGTIEMPYPIFSSRTVKGRPLHTWAVLGKLNEIDIPTKKSLIYTLALNKIETIKREVLVDEALAKIALLPTVTDPRKALGNDFRRPDVLESWAKVKTTGQTGDIFTRATFTCTCSSGTYMRSLAEKIAQSLDTSGLAFHIHRTQIGVFDKDTISWKSTLE